jgi:multicomponent Na+:H+ antiporter subunit E
MMAAMLQRALLFALLWWALAEGRHDGWLFGGAAVIAATWTSALLWSPSENRIRFVQLPSFIGYFLANSVLGGWQVALMALRGRAALQPGFLDMALDLPAGAPQILLTNTLCLMPGTLGVELAGDRLRIHVLDRRLPAADQAQALQQRVAALFGART